MPRASADKLAGASRLQLWFAKVLRDGIAGAAAGSLASFKDIGLASLKQFSVEVPVQLDEKQLLCTTKR